MSEKVVKQAAPHGRPRTYTFDLLDNGKVMRRGHFFSNSKPDPRREVEYQDFSSYEPSSRVDIFIAWAKRSNLEVL